MTTDSVNPSSNNKSNISSIEAVAPVLKQHLRAAWGKHIIKVPGLVTQPADRADKMRAGTDSQVPAVMA